MWNSILLVEGIDSEGERFEGVDFNTRKESVPIMSASRHLKHWETPILTQLQTDSAQSNLHTAAMTDILAPRSRSHTTFPDLP